MKVKILALGFSDAKPSYNNRELSAIFIMGVTLVLTVGVHPFFAPTLIISYWHYRKIWKEDREREEAMMTIPEIKKPIVEANTKHEEAKRKLVETIRAL